MIGIVVIPTGIGADIGGHAGDGNPVAKLIGACCDTLITHPNVVNASDINEMPDNTWYVDGAMLDSFFNSQIDLKPVKKPNRILVVANAPLTEETINAVSAARATIGIDAEVLELETPLKMVATMKDGQASGKVEGAKALADQVNVGTEHFDALAVHTPIDVPRDVALAYYRNGGINPWGGVEALASRAISSMVNKPTAHAPKESVTSEDEELFFIHEEAVDPRIAAEAISHCYLHSVLKGLHKAPRAVLSGNGVSIDDVSFLVVPANCWGVPQQSCLNRGIPIIAVRENKTCLDSGKLPDQVIMVDNYWEAAGVVMSMKAGIHHSSVRRPLKFTNTVG